VSFVTKTRILAFGALACALSACKTQGPVHPGNVQIPVPDTQGKELEPTRESPPESGPQRETPFPKIEQQDLASGLTLDVVSLRTLPLVQIRLLVKSGTAADGDLTGLASMTAKMLKDGGAGRWSSKELLAKIETLAPISASKSAPTAPSSPSPWRRRTSTRPWISWARSRASRAGTSRNSRS
jgi:hypothetical protein